MNEDAPSEVRVAGAILGPLFPPLDLAADDLYERVNVGERVDGRHVPSSLGFQTGVLDHVLVDAFVACVPAVKSLLAAGTMSLITEWMRRRTLGALERRTMELESERKERLAIQQSMERLVELLLRYGIAGDRRLAETMIARIIAQVPERLSDNEDDDG